MCWFTQRVVFPEDVIHSYPAEGEKTTFESPLKEGWIKLFFLANCPLQYDVDDSGISLWGRSLRWGFFEAADGDMRTACGASPSLWERRDFLFSEERQAGSFWSWRHVFPDHEESQLKPHFCAFEEGIHRAWTPSQACLCWSCVATSPGDSELCA